MKRTGILKENLKDQEGIVELNRESCEYYPCHFEDQDCRLCFCPFYPCEDLRTGGKFKQRSSDVIWDCKYCHFIHCREVADEVIEDLGKICDEKRLGDLGKKMGRFEAVSEERLKQIFERMLRKHAQSRIRFEKRIKNPVRVRKKMSKVFVSWSGGKESCLSCYKAMHNGSAVSHLVNFVDENGERSRSHGLRVEVLRAQAEALGIPIVQRRTTWESYEQEFKKAVSELKQAGVQGGVFGDIDLQVHRDWVESVCAEAGVKPVLPLWFMKREKLLEEFIEAGFEAIVVATRANVLDEEWLGRRVDKEFMRKLSKHKQVDLCGEAGEYHTLVIDGPIFRKRMNILESAKMLRNGRLLLDITKLELVEGRKRV